MIATTDPSIMFRLLPLAALIAAAPAAAQTPPAAHDHDHDKPAAAATAAPAATPTPAQPNPYAAMAPLAAYMEKSESDEVALARSAAPPAISASADILAFDGKDYHRIATGTNGWTCLVERSWDNGLDTPDFWNPKIRVPICLNAAATRSVLPVYLNRTKWVLADRALPAIVAKAKGYSVPDPEAGALAIMMSKSGYLADGVGAASPHVMVYMKDVPGTAWAADQERVPVHATPGYKPSITIFYLAARRWSDGTFFTP